MFGIEATLVGHFPRPVPSSPAATTRRDAKYERNPNDCCGKQLMQEVG
jgi:hypothetical protein